MFRKISPSKNAKRGVQIKFMLKEETANFTFPNDFLMSRKSIARKTKNRSDIKKKIIKFADDSPKAVKKPKAKPTHAENTIITG
jgi:hypothetical protein